MGQFIGNPLGRLIRDRFNVDMAMAPVGSARYGIRPNWVVYRYRCRPSHPEEVELRFTPGSRSWARLVNVNFVWGPGCHGPLFSRRESLLGGVGAEHAPPSWSSASRTGSSKNCVDLSATV